MIIAIMISLLFVLGALLFVHLKIEEETHDRLLLLRPDLHINPSFLAGWKNIAAEEGIQVDILFDSEFLYSKKLTQKKYKGIILADVIHSRVSPALAKKIKEYVRSGGYLMLVYDVGTQDMEGNYYEKGSLFSDLVNINYAIGFNEFDEGTQHSPVGQTTEILESLSIPPGKYLPMTTKKTEAEIEVESSEFFNGISTYAYGILNYQHFTTEKINKETPLLLTTPDRQFIAGVVNYGKGKVLFVNLPLTQLWISTDGMFLHNFLHYFASELLHIPFLASVPKGIGGLIMNLHVESIYDLNTFPVLNDIGLFAQGPHSIDITAGPDSYEIGDNKGLDVLHNTKTQNWMHYFIGLGHTIGSDGGWAHNYYGLHANETNQDEFQKYITMNNEAIEKVLDKKVLEYVPSVGNQPNWATRYLEKEKFLGYYTLSNVGVGPTQNFRAGVFDKPPLYSFPILPFGKLASIRDFGFASMPVKWVSDWYIKVSQFVADHHAAHLIYFHPSDVSSNPLAFPQYLESLSAWLDKANSLKSEGIFQWFSMVTLSKFLNERRDVSWSINDHGDSQSIKATHPKSLVDQTWILKKDFYNKPEITVGEGEIREEEKYWVVTAKDVKEFEFNYFKKKL